MTDLSFIVKMVIYKCRELGNPVTETLAAYVAQTTLNECKNTLSKLSSYWQILLGTTSERSSSKEIGRADYTAAAGC